MYPTGNRCGHNKASPRFFAISERYAHRPRILLRLVWKLEQYYYQPRATLPSLDLANESNRQQRSERREACCALLGGLILHADLVSLRVGVPHRSFRGLPLRFLADISGLGQRRAERAMRDLKAAGIIKVQPIVEKGKDGQYRSLGAIRSISPWLFAAFGLGPWLRFEQEKARKRLERQQQRQVAEQLAKLKMLMCAKQRAPSRSDKALASGQISGPRHICEAAKEFFAAAKALKAAPS
ncbi:MAG: replication protein RepA [Methylohalobius sp.]|nr:replication protein RepA [Methylohalobius sp.]